MSPQFHNKVYIHLLVFFICVCLIYCTYYLSCYMHHHTLIAAVFSALKARERPCSVSNTISMFVESSTMFVDIYYNALIVWKRKEQNLEGKYSVSETKVIDFSNNKLVGHIPEGLSIFVGLVSINLSRNHMSGAIPSNIGQLTSLEILDLSHNHLSGEIRTGLAKITTMAILDLSYNNSSGRIPTGPQLQTFDSSTYMGNPRLCGAPLPKCAGDEAATIPQNVDNATQDEQHLNEYMLGMYISVALGLITGFWVVCGTLMLKRS